MTERVLRSVESLREEEEEAGAPAEKEPDEDALTEEELRAENRRLRELLAEREAALAEAEQKAIRQRALYEKAHVRELELEKEAEDLAVEHTELIALREFVYERRWDTASAERNPAGKTDAAVHEAGLDETCRDQIIEKIKDKKVAVLGGTEKWCKRMKRILPSWSFISVEDSMGSLLALESADFIYIYTSALKHSQYYKAMNIVQSGGKMLYYLGSSNTEECLRQFEREVGR